MGNASLSTTRTRTRPGCATVAVTPCARCASMTSVPSSTPTSVPIAKTPLKPYGPRTNRYSTSLALPPPTTSASLIIEGRFPCVVALTVSSPQQSAIWLSAPSFTNKKGSTISLFHSSVKPPLNRRTDWPNASFKIYCRKPSKPSIKYWASRERSS